MDYFSLSLGEKRGHQDSGSDSRDDAPAPFMLGPHHNDLLRLLQQAETIIPHPWNGVFPKARYTSLAHQKMEEQNLVKAYLWVIESGETIFNKRGITSKPLLRAFWDAAKATASQSFIPADIYQRLMLAWQEISATAGI